MKFSENLKSIRKEKGMSQEELALQLHVSRQAVSLWENGESYPEMEKLWMLADLLEVSLDELVRGEMGYAKKQFTGRILIKSFDGKTIVNCAKVQASACFKTRKHQPKYALFGVDGASLFGEHTTVLGWYMDEETLKKEIQEIEQAMLKGMTHYELNYAVKGKAGWLSLKIM